MIRLHVAGRSWLLIFMVATGCEIQGAGGVPIEYPPPALVPATVEPEAMVLEKTVYVPVYSSIYRFHARMYSHTDELVAVTSIRNVEPADSIFLLEARYFDSNGKVVRDYVDKVYELGPMATAEFIVPGSDKSGGPGANFIVRWGTTSELTADPIIETIMLGQVGSAGVSLISRGRTTKVSRRQPR
ncbi:MAG: DUF3124 domain-containing protein [Deltaproteobacteria bacterium]|nr:DUF3124 domain-containing protein [Deltaproteobacteria bacterium]